MNSHLSNIGLSTSENLKELEGKSIEPSIRTAQGMLEHYQRAISSTAELLDQSFDEAVEVIASLPTLLVITGLGKSGLIGQKAAATFASTGTRAVFVHPVEALHGDSGVIDPQSVLLAISKSGGNHETIEFARQFKSVSNGKILTLTEPRSNLARFADIALNIPKIPEIDAWDLAPTTSTLITMSLCDVLAICVQQRKGFTAEHFAQFHPHGTLGKRLRLNAVDFMVQGDDLPIASVDANFANLIYTISSKGLGTVILIDEHNRFVGTITDGDIRRLLERRVPVTDLTAQECFNLSRRGDDLPNVSHGTAEKNTKAIDCLYQMQEDRITSLVIVEATKPIGLVRLQDLVAAGLS